MAESPLLLLGGAAPTLLKDRGALQVNFKKNIFYLFLRILIKWYF